MKLNARASQTSAVPVVFVPPEKRHFVLIAAILASALGFIDGSVLAIALPSMRESLGAGLAQAQWFHNAYMLMLSACVLVGGALGDKLGLGRCFAAGIAGFVAASLLCAVSQSPAQLIGARALQGLAAALMVPGSLAAISRAYSRKERGAAIGIWAASSSLTTALGPALGGLVLSLGGPEAWRLIFAINLPLGGLAVWLIIAHTKDSAVDTSQKVDIAGGVLATLALFLIAFAFTQGSLLCGLAGLAALAVFVLHQAQVDAPMLDIKLFQLRDFSAANLTTLFLWAGFQGVLFYLPMTLIAGWGQDELLTAFTFAPMSVFIALLSSHMGRLASRIGPRPLIFAGALAIALGFVALGVAVAQSSFWFGILPSTSLVGIGLGLLAAPLSTAVINAVPDNHAGAASGVNNAAARVAGLIGVAAFGGLAQAAYVWAGGADSFGAFSASVGHKEAMIAGFQAVSLAAAVLAVLAALITIVGIRPYASSSASQ